MMLTAVNSCFWRAIVVCWFSECAVFALADGPDDNNPVTVRPVPPPGVAVPDAVKEELAAGLARLTGEMIAAREQLKDNADALALLPDAEIYEKAVRVALEHNEFHNVREFDVARRFLKTCSARIAAIVAGAPDWQSQSGLVARGYVSKIDGSVQPYGLVVPKSFAPDSGRKHRLDFWFHGRGETLSELAFVDQRERDPGQFTPDDTFVLHLYGRYCNANKLAGEVDLFEALEKVLEQYPGAIDEDRLVVRGFSMGGAACWQFAVHYAGKWAAAAPGAGFSETPDFLKVFQNETLKPSWYERKLWRMYDCTDWAMNLFHCPTVAYSGEIDRQKQAADMMAAALEAEGMKLSHIIGPGMGHQYHPDSKVEIDQRIDSIVEMGRDRVPNKLKFTTYTLRYNEMLWVTVDALHSHWERAVVDAELVDGGLQVGAENIDAITFDIPAGHWPFPLTEIPFVSLDSDSVPAPKALSDRSWKASYRRDALGKWQPAETVKVEGLHKRHGLQGPIDDAFLDGFMMVTPTGSAWHSGVGEWAKKEQSRAIEHWRSQFRGDARVKNDSEITDEDIARYNLVLWGDPGSNAVLARILDALPLQWTKEKMSLGKSEWPSAGRAPAMIYPNPLNPDRYIVINSGVTFREYDYLNNARQVPKLPDWAIVDLSTPPGSRAPGRIEDAGFFDEQWQWQPRGEQDQ